MPKTHYMILQQIKTNKSMKLTHLYINDEIVHRVDEVVFLGMTIDSNLLWGAHIDKIHNKIARGLFAINSLKHLIPYKHLRLIYNSIIPPHFSYGIFWGKMQVKNY